MRKVILFAAVLCAAVVLQRGAVASPATRVILVGVDGLGARWIPWDDMPNLRALRDDGLYAVGRAHFPTLSAPNWTSVFSGLPIELHGTRDNSGAPKVEPWRPAAGGAADGAALFADLFSELRRQEPGAFTVSAFAWKGIGWCHNTNAVNAARHFGGTAAEYADRDAAAVDWALSFLQRSPRLAFYYQGQVDMAGHQLGWGSAGFTNACRNVDANIGRIVYAYKAAGLWEGAAVVFVADHGGHDKTHGDATLECFEVPFLVSGPAARGLHLREPVVLADTAPTILSLLGLGIPDTMRGRPAIPN
ncbi:MAG: alkaline phosphatase family protein [Kiritimatiellae bacterium]|nr:alkaline phosphatase family protein [Kiritimatiellia bacterium]